MKLSEVGERKIIDIIIDGLEKMPQMPVPFGDDVSAVKLEDDRLAVLKTDMLVAKTDVPPGMSLWHASRKAVVMNISDFAAKGVKPIAMLVSLGLPRGMSEEDVRQISEGLNAGIREYNAYILGGDTNEACDLVIACMLFGIAGKKRLMLRGGAQPGDYVAVTGFFGKTSAGLRILLEDFSSPNDLKKVLVESVLMPKARLREGLALAECGGVTASIDSSDGLAWSLHEISKASGVGFKIDALPIAEEALKFAEIHGLNPVELCFYGGEEYELVLTINPDYWAEAMRMVNKVGGDLIKIGTVTEKREVKLILNGKSISIEPRGWEHFRRGR